MSNDKTCDLPDLEKESHWEKNLSIIVTIVILIAGFTNILSGKEIFFGLISLLALAIL